MLHLISTVAAEAPAPTGSQAPQSPFGGSQLILFIVAMVAIMYFIVIRPNSVRERQRKEMLSSLEKGDKAVTAGGIMGTIVGADEHKVVLRVSEEPALKLEILRTSIARVIKPEQEKEGKKKK